MSKYDKIYQKAIKWTNKTSS